MRDAVTGDRRDITRPVVPSAVVGEPIGAGPPTMSDMARSRGRVGGAVRVLLLAVVVMLATAFGVSMATSGHWLWSIERVTDPTAGDTAVHASARYRAMRLERVAVAEQVLGRRAEALLSGDEQAYLRVLSSGAARLRTTQERIFENLQGVPFDSWSYRVVDVRLPVQGHETAVADTFTAHVEAKYRIDGADLGAVGRGRMMTFTRQGTDWVISADQAVVGTPSDRGRPGRGPSGSLLGNELAAALGALRADRPA
ncbi:MAG: hypothetical protein CSB46_01170 [Micrococcales bacterium]|nr:MAG: hypothetical protein CSB46_01170 [Micrococcales bacterium]